MLKRAVIIVGLGFGDEGKGLATDFYCQRSNNPIVVRFNGGHQAGHTVVKANGTRHVFSSFGAGTLSGAPSYWSSYCTVSLAALLREYRELSEIVTPRLFLDPECPVTTHYDVLYNRAIEVTRGNERHGSCGLGFGATVERHEQPHLRFTVQDLLDPLVLRHKLKVIRLYYKQRINTETKFSFEQFSHDEEDHAFEQDVAEFISLKKKEIIKIVTAENIFDINSSWNTFIFEGAQGILLDMDFGHYPHVTRSNTTSKNALHLLHQYAPYLTESVSIAYVTRCYQTRHGAGPFQPAESTTSFTDELETNVFNEYQGSFRTGLLSIDDLNFALKCDNKFSQGLTKHLIITCLDQLQTRMIPCQINNSVQDIPIDNFPNLLDIIFNKVIFSFSNSADFLNRIN